jgi:hypothetical protein
MGQDDDTPGRLNRTKNTRSAWSTRELMRSAAIVPPSIDFRKALAKAGDPVRRGFPIPSQASLEYWIARLRGR